MQILEPVRQPRDFDVGRYSVTRSYLLMRVVIGVVGILLPIVIVVGDVVLDSDDDDFRASISAYYHSGVRDVFVAGLAVTAFFLLTYKVFEVNLDNTLSMAAGLGALGVALLPTSLPDGVDGLTPLQDWLGEGPTATLHFYSAVLFIGSLGVLSFWFGFREGNRAREGRRAHRSPRFWRVFHWSCAAVIGMAVLYMLVTKGFKVGDSHSLLIGETLAIWAFGASWLMKGLELDVLIQPRSRHED